MAEEEPVVSLYDFIYKDKDRISSYYAQAFRGTLASIETKFYDSNSRKGRKEFGPKIAKASKENENLTSEAISKTISPNDLLTTFSI